MTPTCAPRTGGLETHIALLANGLGSRGHDVLVLTNRDSRTQAEFEHSETYDVLRVSYLLGDLNQPEKIAWEEAVFGPLGEIAHVLSDYRFDILHTHTHVSLLLAALCGTKTPIIASFHETEPHREPVGYERSSYIIRNAPYYGIIAGSAYFVRQAIGLGAEPARIHLVYYGLEELAQGISIQSARSILNSELGIPLNGPVISMTARFKPRKRHLELIRAFGALVKRRRAHLVLVGSCNSGSRQYLTAVEDLINELQLAPYVTLAGECSRELANLVAIASDIVTQPSQVEGFGLAAIEAMLLAKPIVAADVSGLNEIIIDRETGYLVDPTDVSGYARALQSLLDVPEQAAEFGRKGLIRARNHFSAHRMIEETIAVYRSIIVVPRGNELSEV